MFGRKGGDNAEREIHENTTEVTTSNRPPEAVAAPQSSSPRTATATPAVARRVGDVAGRRPNISAVEERKLTVGKGLSLAGEINSCDILVVEGKVEAKLSEGKLLEITEAGQFRGNVEIENADIAGRFDGQLVVHGRLTVRSTGRISGMVKYGELEINAGGQIIGEMQVVGAAAAQAEVGSNNTKGINFKNAARYASQVDEEEKVERKSA